MFLLKNFRIKSKLYTAKTRFNDLVTEMTWNDEYIYPYSLWKYMYIKFTLGVLWYLLKWSRSDRCKLWKKAAW